MNNSKNGREGFAGYLFYSALIAALCGTILVPVTYAIRFWSYAIGEPDSWGQFGDFYGGVLNPIIAFAALAGLWLVIKLQKKELSETRKELAKSAGAQVNLVNATNQSLQISYAATLVPLIEAARNELIAMMEMKDVIDMQRADQGGVQNLQIDRLFNNFRYVVHDLEFNVASIRTRYFCQRMTDRLFSICSLCHEVTMKTGTENVSLHYLHVVGELILGLQVAGGLLVPSYGGGEDYDAMVNWAMKREDHGSQT